MLETSPVPTKYSPSLAVIEKKFVKNITIDNTKELENRESLERRYIKIMPETVCSKGAKSCFNSITRVKQLSKKFYEETFKRNLNPLINEPYLSNVPSN